MVLKEIDAVLKEKERLLEDNRNLERKISSLNRSKQPVSCRSAKVGTHYPVQGWIHVNLK